MATKDEVSILEPISAREVRELYPIISALEALALRESQRFVSLLIPELRRVNDLLKRARTGNRSLLLNACWHHILIGKCRNRYSPIRAFAYERAQSGKDLGSPT